MADFSEPVRPTRPDPASTKRQNNNYMSREGENREPGFFVSHRAIASYMAANAIFFIVGIVSFIRGHDYTSFEVKEVKSSIASHIAASDKRYEGLQSQVSQLTNLINQKSLADQKAQHEAQLLIKQIEIEVKTMNRR